jgi:dTDP-4-dehydrorhamnose 3,5-epimerase
MIKVTKQEYGIQLPPGVRVHELKRFVDDSGSFVEVARLDGAKIGAVTVKQANFTVVEPGIIKAFHLHRYQWDFWFVPSTERMLICLVDLRRDGDIQFSMDPKFTVASPVHRLVLGDGQAKLLQIPPGVAHGYRNLGRRPGGLFYMVSEYFDPDPGKCDELRVPWNAFGAEIWEAQHG